MDAKVILINELNNSLNELQGEDNMFLINKLQYLVFGTNKVQEMTDYYERILGLHRLPTSTATEVLLGQFNNPLPVLVLREAAEPSLLEVGFSTNCKNKFAQIEAQLTANGYTFNETPYTYTEKGITFEDVDGHVLHVHYTATVSYENAINVPRVGPQLGRIQHVTYASPAPRRLAEFYEDVLNFKVSDIVEGNKFVWLRTDKEHHTVAAAAHTEAALDHYAFELADWDAFKEWCDYLGESGIEVIWGPGRHGPGNNLFIFTLDPDGNRIEYSGEMERFRDQYMDFQPRVWKECAQTVNLWGVGAPWTRKLPEKVQ